jgi:starch phosphorylase
MSTKGIAASGAKAAQEDPSKLLKQYGCGPIQFMGNDGLYERHLHFDNVIDEKLIGPRERFEAVARSIRDVLSQRWALTDKTYEQNNPKRVYYLSMEFLLGRSLANNVTNLLLEPLVTQTARQQDVDLLALLEQEPDAGLGNGGLGRLAACFLDSMATIQPWATACDTNMAFLSSLSGAAGNTSSRITGCSSRIRGRSFVHRRRWESS